MPKLTFYRQKRDDGATRTGIELDGETIAERFEGGEGERDPALLWYVDLRCEGAGLPDDPDAATHWLLEQAPIIRVGFARFAERLRAGVDTDLYSLTWSEFADVPEGVGMTIACSAIRRIEAREMSAILADVGSHWDDIIKTIDVPQEVEDLR